PAREPCQFLLASIEAGHIQRLAPIHPRFALREWGTDSAGTTDLLDRDFHQRVRRLSEQPLQPRLIQQHLLVRRLPEHADLLGLTPGGKGLLLHPRGNELFEAFSYGVAAACLPL